MTIFLRIIDRISTEIKSCNKSSKFVFSVNKLRQMENNVYFYRDSIKDGNNEENITINFIQSRGSNWESTADIDYEYVYASKGENNIVISKNSEKEISHLLIIKKYLERNLTDL